MIQQRLVFSSLVTALVVGALPAMSEEKQPATPTVVVKPEIVKVVSDKPAIKFATPKAATLNAESSSGEVLKFNLGYDQEKVVAEIEKAKPKTSQYPLHKALIAPNNGSQSTTYDYKGTTVNVPTAQRSQSFSSSNVGAEASYFYAPNAEYIYEVSANYFTANASTVTYTGTPRLSVRDSKVSTVQAFGRVNYCYWSFSNGARICPGVDLIYDTYPLLGTTFTGTTIATVEMGSATELSGGANVYADIPFYNNLNARFRVGVIDGTGVGRTGIVGSQNFATYGNLDLDWKVAPQHSATLGYSYLSRTVVTDSANVSMKPTVISVGYIFEFNK